MFLGFQRIFESLCLSCVQSENLCLSVINTSNVSQYGGVPIRDRQWHSTVHLPTKCTVS